MHCTWQINILDSSILLLSGNTLHTLLLSCRYFHNSPLPSKRNWSTSSWYDLYRSSITHIPFLCQGSQQNECLPIMIRGLSHMEECSCLYCDFPSTFCTSDHWEFFRMGFFPLNHFNLRKSLFGSGGSHHVHFHLYPIQLRIVVSPVPHQLRQLER